MPVVRARAGLTARVEGWKSFKLWLAGVCLLSASAGAAAQNDPDLRCNGRVENEVWQLWDRSAQGFLRDEMLLARLKDRGDTYALYDVQAYLHNLAAMAARCGRWDRLRQIAQLIDRAFDELTDLPAQRGGGKAWICRGGRVCSAANRLAGTEIALNSQQFLGLAMRVATALAQAPGWPEDKPYVERTAVTVLQHLQRWTAGSDPMRLAERLPAKPSDVRDSQSRLFFTDQDLWLLDIASELAGVLQERPELRQLTAAARLDGQIRAAVVGLFRLLKARTTTVVHETGKSVGADIDRGFWRLHRDSRYAGHASRQKPADCSAGQGRRSLVEAEAVQPVATLGWDFSHARRLVHVMDALDRNRAALQRAFDVPEDVMPPASLTRLLAGQLVSAVWTGDKARPLFSNYWDGTNGWYRVAYDNGTGACFEGYGPSGLSDAFATGGFVQWARFEPVLGELGWQIYRLASLQDADAQAFIEAHYSQLGPRASSNNRMLTQLMFWPSLVQWSPKN